MKAISVVFMLPISVSGKVLLLMSPELSPLIVPFGQTAQLRCSVVQGHEVEWAICLPGCDLSVSTDQPRVLNTLINRGITIQKSTNTSHLRIVGTENSYTAVQCIAVDMKNPTTRYGSKEVTVIFASKEAFQPLNSYDIIIIMTILVIGLVVFLWAVTIMVNFLKKQNKKEILMSPQNVEEGGITSPETEEEKHTSPQNEEGGLMSPSKLPYKVIDNLKHNSEFSGNEFKLVQPNEECMSKSRIIVVEILKDEHKISISDQVKFHEEILTKLHHHNIIRFYGVLEVNIIMREYVTMGGLRGYLRRKKDKMKNTKKLLKMCICLARGLQYISEKNLIHGKISTHSCVVDKGAVIKISDFSMCMILYNNNYKYPEYARRSYQIRWWAPECFDTDAIATVKTDVWSFSVTMWEIYTFCEKTPYQRVVKLASEVKSQKLLEKPKNCPDDVYELMKSCWDQNPSRRPDFKQLCQKLSSLDF